jgi:hypothetical protein
MKDSIVESVIKQFKDRSSVGIEKYGTTLDRTDLTRLDWINHAQQEAMDLVLYLEKLKQEHEALEKYSVLIDEKENYGIKSIVLTDNPDCGVKGIILKSNK